MQISKQAKFWTLLILIYGLAWFCQSSLAMNWDVSWLLHAADRMRGGGSYSRDFFEINPPMILYLYLPPLWIKEFFSVSIFFAFESYIFLLASFSLFISHRVFQKNSYIFILAAAFVFLILPTYEWGQREHLLVILSLPYLLLTVCRVENKKIKKRTVRECSLKDVNMVTSLRAERSNPDSSCHKCLLDCFASLAMTKIICKFQNIPLNAIFIGVMAGIGFAIKPFFLLIPLCLWVYELMRTRVFFRVEQVSVFLILCLYVLSVWVFHRDYFNVVIPVTLQHHYVGFHVPWSALLLNFNVIFCALVSLFFIISFVKKQCDALNMVLMLSLLSALVIYFYQRELWYYHVLPALSYAVLLTISLLKNEIERAKQNKLFCVVLGCFLFLLPLYSMVMTWQWAVGYKKSLKPLINFLHERAYQQSVYFFATTIVYEYPAVDYAGALPVSRFGFMGWIPGVLQIENGPMVKHFFIDRVADDLTQKKPQWILIDVRQSKSNMPVYVRFNYLDYFETNANFRHAFAPYHYVETISEPNVFEFAVYRRG